jgi:hypothetical protein
MSAISGVSNSATASYVVAQSAATAKPTAQVAKPSPAPAQSSNSGLDSDGDHDGGRIDVKA